MDGKVLLYAAAVEATVIGVLSQYIIPSSWVPSGLAGTILGLLLAYGVGLAAFALAFGVRPLRNYVRRNGLGASEAFRWYGLFSLLSLLLVIALTVVYVAVEGPRFEQLLNQPNPVVQEASSNPVFYILLSLLVVGFAEETIFRGYILGTVLTLDGTRRWTVHAVWTSLLFAGVHLYYLQTYLEASPIFYVQIATLGLAFSYAYVLSGGNVIFIALLHGAFDAVTFLGLTTVGTDVTVALHYAIVLLAALWALYLYVKRGPVPDSWDGRSEVTAAEWPPIAGSSVPLRQA